MERTIEQLTVHYRNAERCFGAIVARPQDVAPIDVGVIDLTCSVCGYYWRFVVEQPDEVEHASRWDGSQRLTLRRSTDPTAVPSGP